MAKSISKNVTHLIYFDPQSKPPNKREAQKIIRQIIRARKVVRIPGFSNLEKFSDEFWSLLQNELETGK